MSEKFKSFIQNDAIFYGFMVILVGISSFGLGRASVEVSKAETGKLGLNIIPQVENSELKANTITTAAQTMPGTPVKVNFIASKSGTKYHLPSCPGAKQIKLENQIIFSSKKEAESAGYKPAANCPGLQ